MPELLLELLSEEIPARMQGAAARELERLTVDALKLEGLQAKGAKAYVTPRRLALVIEDLPEKTADVREERKGPRVGAPDAAMLGFLRSTGLAKDQLQTKSDGKSEFYIAVIERPGRATVDVLAEIVPPIVAGFHWPKSMRWGAGTLRWVRPLQNVLCVFNGAAVPFAIATGDGELIANDETVGHRFLAPGKLRVRNFADYKDKLGAAHVVLDADERKKIIARDLAKLAAAEGLEPIEDVGLMDEVCGLIEDPVVLIGRIDESFLDVPPEVLSTAMRAHQKYFSLRDKKTGKFAPRFGVVANLRAKDGGKSIIAGNERVLRARLSDARFFWDLDRKTTLETRVDALKEITFHARLGTQAERVSRIERLAALIAPLVGADADEAARAARLAKADLTSGMVGEFPELQGVMGRYYALKDGESAAVADAIRDHYRPQGPNDSVPSAPVSIAVALADKLDMLKSFFSIDEKPTGSKDPFAIRRSAIGVIRIILENALHLDLLDLVVGPGEKDLDVWIAEGKGLHSFVLERLKVFLRDKGERFDLVDAVTSLSDLTCDLFLILRRLDALRNLLETDNGRSLRVAHERATNILRIEEKRDNRFYNEKPDAGLFQQDEERRLFAAIQDMQKETDAAVAKADFEAAMRSLAKLRAPVDIFFDKVTVNAKEPALRENRLRLLSLIRRAMTKVADFPKIEGGAK